MYILSVYSRTYDSHFLCCECGALIPTKLYSNTKITIKKTVKQYLVRFLPLRFHSFGCSHSTNQKKSIYLPFRASFPIRCIQMCLVLPLLSRFYFTCVRWVQHRTRASSYTSTAVTSIIGPDLGKESNKTKRQRPETPASIRNTIDGPTAE